MMGDLSSALAELRELKKHVQELKTMLDASSRKEDRWKKRCDQLLDEVLCVDCGEKKDKWNGDLEAFHISCCNGSCTLYLRAMEVEADEQ